MKLGACFKMEKPGEIGHLWVVISRPTLDHSVVMVSITTYRADTKKNSDRSCVLSAGDHPFIRHESIAAYSEARIVDVENQKIILKSPTICEPREPVPPHVLKRLQQGALVSDNAAQKIQAILSGQGVEKPKKP